MTKHLQISLNNIHEGMRLPTLEKQPTTRQLVMYAGSSGDFYEIHYDHKFAHARGFPNVIVHGALKSAFLCQLITDWIGELGTLKRLSVQYRMIDMAGNLIYCKGIVSKRYIESNEHLVECNIWIENINGEKTTAGTAIVSLLATKVESLS